MGPARLRFSPYSEDEDDRRKYGQYYTPPPLVRAVHRLLADALRESGIAPRETTLVDPACGPGPFLADAEARRYPRRFGLDLDRRALAIAADAAVGSELLLGDAYGDGLEALSARIGRGPIAVLGNPPYVGNSALLRSGRYHEVRDRLLPFARDVARGGSIRDDYVLFFGVADRLIEAAGGTGAIAFVTSASFLDNFLYAPLRRWLLSRYRLHDVVELGGRIFEGTRVSTAITVWTRHAAPPRGFRHARLEGDREQKLAALERPLRLSPAQPWGPSLLLNAPGRDEIDAVEAMRRCGDPIGAVFPVSLPGLKTRFDELLTAPTHRELKAKMEDFFSAGSAADFARRHGLPERSRAKLEALFAARADTHFSEAAIHPYARYAGRKHRFRVPDSAMAWAYVDRALIPRGDHRLRGPWNPHRGRVKLIFNVREVPLSSAVLTTEAAVHDYRHARFAPLYVPPGILQHGLGAASRVSLQGKALNLMAEWSRAAAGFRRPEDVLFYVSAVINSRLVQEVFAPRLGASEEVPLARPTADRQAIAQQLADVARRMRAGGDLPEPANRMVEQLYGL